MTDLPSQHRSVLRGLPFALALLVCAAGMLDLGHDHGLGVDSSPCYASHFSPDLGLGAQPAVPPSVAPPRCYGAGSPNAVPRTAAVVAYDARGPPLLS